MTRELRTVCPFCRTMHELVTAARGDDAFPEDGDATLCFRCGAFCIYDSDARGGLREPNNEEQRRLETDPQSSRLLSAWRTSRN